MPVSDGQMRLGAGKRRSFAPAEEKCPNRFAEATGLPIIAISTAHPASESPASAHETTSPRAQSPRADSG
jgi:hypothetical protein